MLFFFVCFLGVVSSIDPGVMATIKESLVKSVSEKVMPQIAAKFG